MARIPCVEDPCYSTPSNQYCLRLQVWLVSVLQFEKGRNWTGQLNSRWRCLCTLQAVLLIGTCVTPYRTPKGGRVPPHSYAPLLRRPKKYSTYTRSEDELAMCITIPGHKSCSRNRKHCINCDWPPVKRSSKLIGNAAGSIDGINPSLAKSHNRVPANSSRRQCRYRCNV